MTTHQPRANTGGHERGLDRAALMSHLLAGALLLLVLVALDSWPLALIGAVYVGLASAFIGFFSGARLVAWLCGVALWVWLLGSVMFENTVTHYVISSVAGVVVGSLCFLAWQALAAGMRTTLFGRRSPQPS